MRLRRLVAVLLLLVAAAPLSAARRRAVSLPGEEGLSETEWLHRHAMPFATTEPGSGVADLRVLDAIVGDARLVTLGEATHASHEFFATKHRIIEYLVQEKGFTVFSMEANLPDVDALNEYVTTGRGDPAAILQSLGYWVWDTREVLDLILWMRGYNESRGSRPAVSFRGFDAQGTRVGAQALAAYLQRVDESAAASLMQFYDCYRPYEVVPFTYAGLSSAVKEPCHANVAALHDTIASRREVYVPRSSAGEYERMLRYARTIVQAEEMNSGRRGDPDGRDEFMAENIAWIANVEHPGEKVIAWAHNGHVAAELDYLMGSFLRRVHFPGDRMVIFGFAFDRGSFNAYDFPVTTRRQVFTVVSPDGGHEAFLRTAGQPLMFVDIRHASSAAARRVLDVEAKRMWEIGAVYDASHPDDFRPLQILSRNYDVIIWIETVRPTTLNH